MLDELLRLDIPACLRVCAGTDGSVTHLLELLTLKTVEVRTVEQEVVQADANTASMLGVNIGDDVNRRTVNLCAGGIVYVHARSLTPLSRLSDEIKDDMIRADIPIGKILRMHRLETRRDFRKIEVTTSPVFKGKSVLSREYDIIHGGSVLMWINEIFPIDDRWALI